MSKPLVSIIMPVYNVAKYINLAIDSVLKQTFEDYELIISDDGSTDDTVMLIKRYNDRRIKFYENKHIGFISQLNFCIDKAAGKYFARMDGDDFASPEKMETQIRFLEENKKVNIVGTNYYAIGEDGKLLYEKKFPEGHEDIEFMMPIIPSFHHPTMITDIEIIRSIGGYTKDYFCEDVVLFMKLLSKGYNFYNIQKPLYYYRIVKKDDSYYKDHYRDYYKYSSIYLDEFYKNAAISVRENNLSVNNFVKKNSDVNNVLWEKLQAEKYFRFALLEYYLGKMNKARKYFIKCLKYKHFRYKIIFRYLPLTLLGDFAVKRIRDLNITGYLNYLIFLLTGYDTNKIKK